LNAIIIFSGRLIRFVGNIFKLLSYPFHWVFPRLRFSIPEYSPARIRRPNTSGVPKVIWQTNFTHRCSLPMYLNYLFNRLMSLDFDYHYISTEARDEYLRKHAPKEVYEAYTRLTNGAAQADLWRVSQLYNSGGIYMDIDATLIWPLHRLLKGVGSALYIKARKNDEITNYFLAAAPHNPHFKQFVERIVHNIQHYDPKRGVYGTTGPVVLNEVLAGQSIECRYRNYVCLQGTFTNEYFQYIDKPRGKWTRINPEDLVKK
jgi:mannosyltransferase OCH1-like enzyme